MNKRAIPMIVACCIIAAASLAGYMLPKSSEATPTRLLLENPGGRVVFTHQDHSTPGGKYGNSSCAACHHELNMAGATGAEKATGKATPMVIPCKSCHGATDNPKFSAEHQKLYQTKGGGITCASCHHTRMKGFAKGWNHEEHQGYAGDCVSCHHPDYKKPSGEKVSIEPQKCSNCHTSKPSKEVPVSLKDAGHARCVSCHENLFEDKIKGCASCHEFTPSTSTASEAAGKANGRHFDTCVTCHAPLPGVMDAFHNQCMSCHDKAGKGPGVKAPCAQCHTP